MSDAPLTTVEANAICVYADRCLKVLNLRHWAVYLRAEPCRNDAIASIDPTDGRYVALIHVSAEWRDRETAIKRATIMHECLHLLHAQADDHLRNVLRHNTQISEDLIATIDQGTGEIVSFVQSYSDTDVTWTAGADASTAHLFPVNGEPTWGAHERPLTHGFQVYDDGSIAGTELHVPTEILPSH